MVTRDLASDGRGAVYVETIICFLPVFILFLGVVQLSFIASAKLVVRHAAVMGARSAIVVLEDDDPGRYGEEGFGVIDYQGSGASVASTRDEELRHIAGWFGENSGLPSGVAGAGQGGPRLREIRKAAYVPLLAVAPPPVEIARWFGPGERAVFETAQSERGLGDAIGSSPWQRFAAGLAYNRAAAVVTFHRQPRSPEIFEGAFGPTDSVTVRVSYLFHCAVPLVSRFMCKRPFGLFEIFESAQWLRNFARHPARFDPRTLGRMTGETGQRLQRLERNLDLFSRAESPALTAALILADARFAQLTAEATMPIQGAGYYRNRDRDD
jgi:hypothetical protein